MGTAKRAFLHLDLRVGHDGEGHFARVEKSPCGEGAVRLDLECLLPWLERLEQAGGACRNLVPAAELAPPPTLHEEAERVGRALGRMVFQGEVRRCYDDGLTEARRAGKGLAIRLRVDEDPFLLSFPWEVMFGPGGTSPLATSAETPLVRLVPVEGSPSKPPAVAHLRILLAVAQPRGFTGLDVEKEVEGVRASLGRRWFGPAIRVDVLSHTTAGGLREALERGRHHVVHFIGHGLPPAGGREGQIVLETAQGDPDCVSGQRLADILGLGSSREPWNELRLVVLNACHGAEAEPSDGFAGVAQRLLTQGLAAVVAMRSAIADRAAIQWSSVFYRRLAQGETAARAISRARRELHADVPDCSWLKPVLFERAREGGIVLRARGRRLAAALGAAGIAAVAATAAVLVRDRSPDPYRGGPLEPPLPVAFFADDPRCPSPEGVTLGFVYIPPGEFWMGSEENDEEQPRHRVPITRPFCLGKTEVTVAQWEVVKGDGSRAFEQWRAQPGADLPQGGLTLEEVRQWVAWLNRPFGEEVYFLVHEAQWEYSARAGSSGRYSFADSDRDLPRYANCGHGPAAARARPLQVGSYPANGFGLYDMHGNVSEWVDSPFDYYRPEAQGLDLRREALWVRRGGSYSSSADTCRSAARARSQPTTRSKTYGFRIARWPASTSLP